jgi:ABC-type nitrate/sulfonate/bicarbonate transport system substrate-binding protein
MACTGEPRCSPFLADGGKPRRCGAYRVADVLGSSRIGKPRLVRARRGDGRHPDVVIQKLRRHRSGTDGGFRADFSPVNLRKTRAQGDNTWEDATMFSGFRSAATSAALLFVLAAPIAAAPAASAQSLKPVSVIAFHSAGTWLIDIAQDKGYFAQDGIKVTLTPTPGSVYQLTNLIAGKFDIGTTSVDNVIAYQEGEGEVAVARKPDLFVFMGGSPSVEALVTRPEIKTYQDLKGKTVAVDAKTTGYAFVLYDLLKRAGLQPADYKVATAGGTGARWKGMQEGKYAAALLSPPLSLVAKAKGYHLLSYAKDVYGGHYEASVGTTRRSWAAANEQTLVAYIKAYVRAVDWLRDPQNKTAAIAILRKYFPQISPQIAEATYTEFIGPRGVAPKAKLDLAGVAKVLELRNQYGKLKQPLSDPSKYYDPKYYDEAVK